MLKNEKLLEYAKKWNGEKQAWLGVHPQFDMDVVDIEACTNYRLAPKFHGQYDTVWAFEKPLNEWHVLSWKIVLDEAVRLLKRSGKLIVKLYQTQSMTVPMLKNFIGRNINLHASIDYEYNDDNYYNIVFNIERLNFETYRDKSWTFAMLTNGKKDEVVIKFLDSIRNNERQKNQIIIAGPRKNIYDKYNVEYLDLSKYRDDEYAEISRKKNDIARLATGANILIAHDRYYLDDKFFTDMDDYGYDFDFLAMRQVSEVGNKEFPSYCYYYGEPLNHTHVGYSTCYSKLLNTQYVNGGLIVLKTKTLLEVEFNDLIFWNQKEDAEMAYVLAQKSIIIRVNFLSSIHTTRSADEFLWDIFDGEKSIYNEPNTQKDKPSVCGAKPFRFTQFNGATKKVGIKACCKKILKIILQPVRYPVRLLKKSYRLFKRFVAWC